MPGQNVFHTQFLCLRTPKRAQRRETKGQHRPRDHRRQRLNGIKAGLSESEDTDREDQADNPLPLSGFHQQPGPRSGLRRWGLHQPVAIPAAQQIIAMAHQRPAVSPRWFSAHAARAIAAMRVTMAASIRRWSAHGKTARGIGIVPGRTMVVKGSRSFALPPSEIGGRCGAWGRIHCGRAPPDIRGQYAKQLKEASGAAKPELCARQKTPGPAGMSQWRMRG